eukprot:EG_transcript_30980
MALALGTPRWLLGLSIVPTALGLLCLTRVTKRTAATSDSAAASPASAPALQRALPPGSPLFSHRHRMAPVAVLSCRGADPAPHCVMSRRQRSSRPSPVSGRPVRRSGCAAATPNSARKEWFVGGPAVRSEARIYTEGNAAF